MMRSHLSMMSAFANALVTASVALLFFFVLSPAVAAPSALIESIAATAAPSAEYSVGQLRITAPWMRATPKGATVASGYMTITNTGKEPDRLLRVESDIATTVEVHEMSVSGEVMKMRPLEKPLEIEPGGMVELKPNGYHLMFSRLRQGVNEGDKVSVTMVFEKAGKVEIELPAAGIAAKGPANEGTMPEHKM